MASGYITGWQHMLMDMPELTKESFIDYCDKAFYHLERFGYETVEDYSREKKRRIERDLRNLEQAKAELKEVTERTDEEWKKEYKAYVNQTEASNRKYRESYDKEKARMIQIWELVEQVRPHLDYIWKEFKEPELFQIDICSLSDYKEGAILGAKRHLEFRQRDVEAHGDEEHKENEDIIQDYEAKKKALLEGEANWISENSSNGQRTQTDSVEHTQD